MKKTLYIIAGAACMLFNGIYCSTLHVNGWHYIVVLSSAIVGTLYMYEAGKL